jgi:hypothetical protein
MGIFLEEQQKNTKHLSGKPVFRPRFDLGDLPNTKLDY